MFEEIKGRIAEALNVDESIITPESSLIHDLKADSMDVATLLLELEEKYDVEIGDDDLENLKTVGDIVSYIESHK